MKITLLTLMYISYFFYYYSNNNTISIIVKDNYMTTPPENIYLNDIINGKIYFDFKNNSNIYCEKNNDIFVNNQIYNINNLYNYSRIFCSAFFYSYLFFCIMLRVAHDDKKYLSKNFWFHFFNRFSVYFL